jgi:hypothetical protein
MEVFGGKSIGIGSRGSEDDLFFWLDSPFSSSQRFSLCVVDHIWLGSMSLLPTCMLLHVV